MTATATPAKTEPASRERSVQVWDLPLRVFHWLLVVTIAIAFLSSEEDSPLNQWHVLAGWVAGILIVFRLVWGFVGGQHSRFTDFIRPSRLGAHVSGVLHSRSERTLGHNPLGGLSVVALLALIAGTVWTGAFGGEGADDIHELIAWTLLAFVCLHIAAVVIMSLLEHENLVSAMITGKKSAARHAGASDARRPRAIGILITAAAVAVSVYGILQYDPKACTLRPAESFEQPATSPGVGEAAEEREKD